MITLYESGQHKNILFHDLSEGLSVQANQHVIIDGGRGMLLDPGGHKVYPKLLGEISGAVPISSIDSIILSHQDPDIVAATNGWLMVTEAKAYVPSLWTRFIPHFGVDSYVESRLVPVPDGGAIVPLNGKPIMLIPAHFIHASGNLHVYDAESKIYYSGDLGASLGQSYTHVEDFDAHIQYMEGFHRRYMPSSKALRMWAKTVRKLDIETIAPQHGAVFVGRELSRRFIEWVETIECGVELMGDEFPLPGQ